MNFNYLKIDFFCLVVSPPIPIKRSSFFILEGGVRQLVLGYSDKNYFEDTREKIKAQVTNFLQNGIIE